MEKQTCGNFHWISQLYLDFEWKVWSNFSLSSVSYLNFPLSIWNITSKLLNIGKIQLMIIPPPSQEASELWGLRSCSCPGVKRGEHSPDPAAAPFIWDFCGISRGRGAAVCSRALSPFPWQWGVGGLDAENFKLCALKGTDLQENAIFELEPWKKASKIEW